MTPLIPHLMRDSLVGFRQVVDLTIAALSVLTGDVGPDERAAVGGDAGGRETVRTA